MNNWWCEGCARKDQCYTSGIKPKCFVPITNTAHGTPQNYLVKAIQESRDSHEIADTPQTEDYDFRDEQEYNDRWGTDCPFKDVPCSCGEQDDCEWHTELDTPQTDVYDYKGNGKWERSE